MPQPECPAADPYELLGFRVYGSQLNFDGTFNTLYQRGHRVAANAYPNNGFLKEIKMSKDMAKEDGELHQSPDAIPRRSERINKGKAPQRLEDCNPGEPIRKELRYLKEKLSVRTKKRSNPDRVEKDMASNEKRGRNGVTSPAGMETNKRSKTWTEQAGQLLPGIPDDIILTTIAPKLPWRDVHTLLSVSRGWQQTIESREVYNEKVRTQSTETLAVIHHVHPRSPGLWPVDEEDIHALGLYSIRDKYWYDLPPIPFCGGIPSACQHVSLDGKVYVLGGVTDSARDLGSKEVYVLDLAGQGQWKRCAKMHKGRLDFGAEVLDGKIYVFGGCSLRKLVSVCEVYDPKINAWSPIQPMLNYGRVNHKVATVGEEIFLYGGEVYDQDHRGHYIINNALVLDAYHPVRDQWRQIAPFRGTRYWDKVFMAQGKFHKRTSLGIFVYDIDKDSWSLLYSFLDPIGKFRQGFLASGLVRRTVALGDELLFADVFGKHSRLRGCCLSQTKGFGSKNKEIAWEEVKRSLFFDSRSSFAYPIQL